MLDIHPDYIKTIRKNFEWNGVKLRIVEREESYQHAEGSTLLMTRVINENGRVLPVRITQKDTLKQIVANSQAMLDAFVKESSLLEVLAELNK